ncbi:farnesol dehydrogenase-like isoform X2 [Cloeon dipterum]|uniref:farnesol dehydrogenase-like isoform X2 n=1 Tax=Cloeon dipterum TaxID=197152 RepID=UPI003220775E
MHRWVGKVALLTEVAEGFGPSLANHLVNRGVRVVGLAKRVDNLGSSGHNSRVPGSTAGTLYAHNCDITKGEDIMRVLRWTRARLGGVDILINNAEAHKDTQLMNPRTISPYLHCAFMTEVLRDMQNSKEEGHVINIGSVADKLFPYFGIYEHRQVGDGVSQHEIHLEAGNKIKVTNIVPDVLGRRDLELVLEDALLRFPHQEQEKAASVAL